MAAYRGAHPAIGALDVCPLVWLDPADRDAARTEAVAVATQIGGLGMPVFLYGELARDPGRAERAYFRNGGLAELWLRMEAGELRARLRARRCRTGAAAPPWSPPGRRWPPSTSSSTAATSRSPARSPPGCARRAAACRGCGRSGWCSPAAAARSRPTSTTRWRCRSARWSRRCGELAAPLGARPLEAELVGLIPAAALAGYPDGRADARLRPGHST